jgi:AraC family transcriptional regulator of adaptative response / DNA-3-methyladenine glycosylase II
VILRLPVRQPFDARSTLAFLARRAVAGLERADGDGFVRSLALPGGPAIVGLYPADGAIRAELQLTQLADLTTAVARCRRLLDLDADPAAVVEVLGSDPVIGRLVHANPGRRSPASVDGAEQAVRAVLGQQVSVAAARTVTAKLVATYGSPLPSELVRSAPGSPTHSFPPMDVLAGAEPDLPIPAARRRTIAALAAAVVDRTLSLDIGADRRQAAEALLRLPGVGPWTAAYVSMRALGDPDVFLATDLGVRHALEQLGAATHPAAVSERARAWAPWRSYALHHLWASLDPQEHTR